MKVPVYDIIDCGPRNRFGANGKVVHNCGSINLQNLKRKSFLRMAIMAPPGHSLVVGDLSQIEPRVLAWLADYHAMLDIFRAGGDPYATFGAQMFGVPGLTRESHPLLRQSAKSALLGCLGGETKVLTANGYKDIVDIRDTDLLWDGDTWVTHQGLLQQGLRAVETSRGLTATPDHKVLVQGEWHEWHEVHTNPSLFQQALSSVSLPVLTGEVDPPPLDTSSMRHGCGAPADVKDFQAQPVCTRGAVNAASSAATNKLRLRSRTGLKNLFRLLSGPLLGNSHALHGDCTTECSIRECGAVADGPALSLGIPYKTGAAPGVTNAPNGKRSKRVGPQRGTTLYARTERTVTDYWTESARLLCDVLTRKVKHTLIMAGVALRCTPRGLKTVLSFCGTLSPSMVGMNPAYSSTEKTTNVGTYPATYASSRAASTWPTNAASQRGKLSNCANVSLPLKQRTQTYDIALAGPRNRYTILTDAGPVIVHNCGYGLGWSSFAGQLLVGFLGAPPVRYTKADAKQLGVTQAQVQVFANDARSIARMNTIPHTCTEQELLVHCLAAKAIIDKYRAAAAPVINFWAFLGEMIERCLVGGAEYTYKCLTFKKAEIVLANGMSLLYPDLKMSRIENADGSVGSGFTYADGAKRVKLYPGKVCNNVTQGTARIVMTDGMLRTAKRFPVKGTVHDEEIVLVPDEELPEAKTWVHAQMVKEPKWMPGIPLAADVSVAKRYGEAK